MVEPSKEAAAIGASAIAAAFAARDDDLLLLFPNDITSLAKVDGLRGISCATGHQGGCGTDVNASVDPS